MLYLMNINKSTVPYWREYGGNRDHGKKVRKRTKRNPKEKKLEVE
jgi:hypothetical protein